MKTENMQDALEAATDDIITARQELARLEMERLYDRQNVTIAEADLAMARLALMASPEAGKNETERRAYADAQTSEYRAALATAENELLDTERGIIDATARLRIAEDRRRYLETIIRLNERRDRNDLERIVDEPNSIRLEIAAGKQY